MEAQSPYRSCFHEPGLGLVPFLPWFFGCGAVLVAQGPEAEGLWVLVSALFLHPLIRERFASGGGTGSKDLVPELLTPRGKKLVLSLLDPQHLQ